MKATEKQIKYASFLLEKAGYGTKWMSAKFKRLGAGMRERSGPVENWLKSLTMGEIGKVIDTLKKEIG